MTTPPKLHAPMCHVLLDDGLGGDPDGKTLDLQTNNVDMVLWDRTRAKHKWPGLQEAPFLWMTFISWSAARRTGLIPPDYTYETWEAKVLDIDVDEDEEANEVEAHPPGQEAV